MLQCMEYRISWKGCLEEVTSKLNLEGRAAVTFRERTWYGCSVPDQGNRVGSRPGKAGDIKSEEQLIDRREEGVCALPNGATAFSFHSYPSQ